ncbi:MAG TPA: oligosaccharide flippase family protein [Pyrinomonadaceae bacterium]|nr:oligosaccharide flippase family protein [Pyrinomonadaceae bacterium]HMP64931.1 oligosaccharide flippase family protein [Pyrinomonadaceae bacterium]
MTARPRAAQTSANVVRNVLYGSLTWVLPVFLSLLATPLLIESLSIETYGVYVLILGLISYSFSFGLGRAAVKYIAEYLISGKTGEIRNIFSATMILSVAVGMIGLLLIFVLANWLVKDLLRIEESLQESATTGIRIAGAVIFISGIAQAFWSVLQGAQRFDIYSKLFNANSVLLLSGNLLLAYFGFGLATLLWWNLASLTLMTVISGSAAMRTVPGIGFGLTDGVSALPRIMGFTTGIVGYQLLGNALLLIERGWITRTFGSSELSYYVVAMSLGLYILGFSNSLALVIAPLTSETQADKERLRSVYLRSTKFIVMIVGFLVMALITGRHVFLSLWIGPDFADRASDLMAVHLISFGLFSIVVVSWQMREGLGFPSHNLWITAVYFALTLGLMYLFTIYWETLGVAMARLVGCMFMAAFIFQFERWLFGKVAIRYWAGLLLAVAGATAAAGAANIYLLSLFPRNWLTMLFAVAISGGIYGTALVLFRAIDDEERRFALAIFKR